MDRLSTEENCCYDLNNVSLFNSKEHNVEYPTLPSKELLFLTGDLKVKLPEKKNIHQDPQTPWAR